MKNLLVCILSASLIIGCSSMDENIDEANVPSAVRTAYQAKYPGAVTKKWKSETENGQLVYEVKFELNDQAKEAEFLSDGTLKEED